MVIFAPEMATDLREGMRGGAGAARLTALSAQLPAHMRLFSTITLAPGSGIGYHVHEGETELFYFISGKGRVQDDADWVAVSAGDCMSTPSGHGHAVENTGEEDLILLAAIVLD
ncbi:MAG: cupin domain-containing protein [Christensenellales bacterium]|jgi:mannose-6-phosphate isomerase-like protein (cupin superfamily)